MLSFQEILSSLHKEEDEQERQVIGWTCTYLPLEILEAGGLQPYRILPTPSSEKADAYLDPNFCPLIKASLGTALTGGYSFLSGIVMVNTCDGMRRLYDAWRFYSPSPFCFFLDLPRVITSSSIAYFSERLQEFLEEIENTFQAKITEDALAGAIEDANFTRFLLRRLLSLKGMGNPPLRYGDILEIFAEQWRNPRKVFNKALERYVAQFEMETPFPSNGLKLMVTGSLLDGSPLIHLLEDLGGEVVASDLCTGERFLERVDYAADPLRSLGEAYLKKPPCARMYDTERRISHIRQKLIRTSTQGVIYFTLKFCDPYLYEAPALKAALQEMDIPILFIEADYTARISGGSRTRVQAFLEMLEGNVE